MTPYFKILEQTSKPHWFEIIQLIKCSEGLSVGELAEALDMSYMGVKKHCLAMHKLGYLDTWRRPKGAGRPEKAYRLTDKIAPLFPAIGDEVCLALLEAASQLEPNSAEKLLFAFYRQQTETLMKVVAADSVQERAENLAKERTRLGYLSFCRFDEEGALWIEEFHHPLQRLATAYPTLERMEVQMFEKLLGARVERSYRKVSGLTLYRFDLSPP